MPWNFFRMDHFWIRKIKIFLIATQLQIPLFYKIEYLSFLRTLKSVLRNGLYRGGVLSNHQHPLWTCIAAPVLVIINLITMLGHMDIIHLPLLPLLGTITTIITNTIMETTIPNKRESRLYQIEKIIKFKNHTLQREIIFSPRNIIG